MILLFFGRQKQTKMIQEKQKFVMEDLAKVEPAVEEARQGMHVIYCLSNKERSIVNSVICTKVLTMIFVRHI